jgi:hypothetical protein
MERLVTPGGAQYSQGICDVRLKRRNVEWYERSG